MDTRALSLLLLLCAACGDDSSSDAGESADARAVPTDAVPLDAVQTDGSNPDGTVTGIEDCTADVRIPVERGFEPDRFYQLMEFTNDELGLRLRVALSPGETDVSIGLAINYMTRRFAVETADGLVCVRDEEALTYEVSQHNDTDTLAARVGADERFVVSMIYDRSTSSFTDTLTIEHPQSGATSDGPYPLTEAGCSVHREDGVSECTYQVRPPFPGR